LPSGQTLDPATGCITGTRNGLSPGSDEVTITAQDKLGNTGSVTCAYLWCSQAVAISNMAY
jgi:hypothetical protein